MPGLGGILFDFLAQIMDKSIDGPRRRELVISPGLIEDRVAADDLPLVGDEELQKAELLGLSLIHI